MARAVLRPSAEKAAGHRARGQLELAAVHRQVGRGVRVVVGVHDRNRLAVAGRGRGQVVGTLQVTGAVPGQAYLVPRGAAITRGLAAAGWPGPAAWLEPAESLETAESLEPTESLGLAEWLRAVCWLGPAWAALRTDAVATAE